MIFFFQLYITFHSSAWLLYIYLLYIGYNQSDFGPLATTSGVVGMEPWRKVSLIAPVPDNPRLFTFAVGFAYFYDFWMDQQMDLSKKGL